jgi:hypothetical protein
MVHESQCLPFLLEAGDDVRRVQAGLDDLPGDAAADWRLLLSQEDGTHAALTQLLQQFVRADPRAGAFRRGRFQGFLVARDPLAGGPRLPGRSLLRQADRLVGDLEESLDQAGVLGEPGQVVGRHGRFPGALTIG